MRTLFLTSIIVFLFLSLSVIVFSQTTYYYIENTTSGYYYAVYTNGSAFKAFYLDNGTKYYITTGWWDANTSYIIFKSPINGTVYLEPTTGLSTISTVDEELPTTMFSGAYNYTVWFPKTDYNVYWSPQVVSGNLYKNYTVNERSLVFNGSSLIETYNVTYVFENKTATASIAYNYLGPYLSSQTANYTITNIIESINVTISTIGWYDTGSGTAYNTWATRPTNTNYDFAEAPLTYNITSQNVTVSLGSRTNYASTLTPTNYWNITFGFPQNYNVTAYNQTIYTVSNGVIDTGVNKYVVLDLNSLKTTDGSLGLSLTKQPDLSYYIPGQTVNITFSLLYPDGSVANGVLSDMYVNANKIGSSTSYPATMLVSTNPWGVTQIDIVYSNPITGGSETKSVFLYPKGFQASISDVGLENATFTVSFNRSVVDISLPDFLKQASQYKEGLYFLTIIPILFLMLANRIWSAIAAFISAGLMYVTNTTVGYEFFDTTWIGIIVFIGVLGLFSEVGEKT